MVDSDVLIQEIFQLFVLVMELSGFIYQLLAGLEEIVIF